MEQKISNQSETSTSLMRLIGDYLPELPETFDEESDLFQQGLDSMGIMHLILVFEEEFGVQLHPSDISREHFSTVRGIASLLRIRRGEK